MAKNCCSRQDHDINENNEIINNNPHSDGNEVVTNNANNDPNDKQDRSEKEHC